MFNFKNKISYIPTIIYNISYITTLVKKKKMNFTTICVELFHDHKLR